MNRNLEKNEKIWRRSPSEIETDEVIQNVALLTFNLGVEIGQVAFVISVLGAFWLIAQSLKKLDIESVAWLKKIVLTTSVFLLQKPTSFQLFYRFHKRPAHQTAASRLRFELA